MSLYCEGLRDYKKYLITRSLSLRSIRTIFFLFTFESLLPSDGSKTHITNSILINAQIQSLTFIPANGRERSNEEKF